jgi:O-antigen/teichoic acid export membrane protein
VFRGGVTFAVAAVLQRAAPILLLPFFARILTAEEFGQIGVIVTLAAALTTLLTFGLETAIFLDYSRLRGDPPAADAMVTTVGGFAILAPIGLATAIAALAAPTLGSVLGLPAGALVLGCLGAAATVAATLVPLTIMRAQERLRAYLQLTSIQVVVTVVLTTLFVAVLGWGVAGWMLANALSGALLLGRGLVLLRHRWSRADVSLDHLRRALAFGLPLIPHAFSHWGLAVSDRVILAAYVSDQLVGAYYVAYQLSLPVTLVAIALSQGSQPIFAEAVSHRNLREVEAVTTTHALIVMLTAGAVALLGPPLALLVLPATYAPTAEYLPWLAAGACCFGLYLMPMNAITITAGRSGGVWMVTVLAAAANVGLNLAMVPRIGPYAAALNSTVGYAILLLGVICYMRFVCNLSLRLDTRRLAVGAGLIALACLLGGALTTPGTSLGLGMRLLLVAGLGLALVLTGPLRREAATALHVLRPTGSGGAG